MAFTIKVNGNTHSVDVDGDTPLLWVLRDVLGMTATKFDCGIALCGACTAHLNGVPARSCITSVESVGTKTVTTIEAIGATAAGKKGLFSLRAKPRDHVLDPVHESPLGVHIVAPRRVIPFMASM